MGLGRLGERGALFVAAVLTASVLVPGCGNKSSSVSPSNRPSASDPSSPTPPNKFPNCGPDAAQVEILKGQARNGGDLFIIPAKLPPEVGECVIDTTHKRDCSEIRRVARMRLNLIPRLFTCDDEQPVFVGVYGHSDPEKISSIIKLGALGDVEGTKGDCNDVITAFEDKIFRKLQRIGCGVNGEPYERLGWGESEDGEVFNPCAGGSC